MPGATQPTNPANPVNVPVAPSVWADPSFRQAVEACLPIGLAATDKAGRQTYVNPAFCRMVGWAAGELLGAEPPFAYWPTEEATKIRTTLREVAERGCPPGGVELRLRRRNGERFTASVRLAPLAEGGWLAAVTDLSGQRQAEAERARLLGEQDQLADQLGLLLESTAEGCYGVDRDGNCTFINRAAAALLGYPPSEVIGRNMHDLAHHTRADGEPNPAAECAFCSPPADRPAGRLRGEMLCRRDGGRFPVEYSVSPVVRGGAGAGAVVSFADLTERERLEGQLRQAQKMESVGRLAGGVAHDFNNLLTVINGCTQLVLSRGWPEETATRFLEDVREAGARAAGLTQQLLMFSRQQIAAPQLLRLGAVVADTERMLRRLTGETIRFEVHTGATAGLVKVDRGQLQQVLLNLVVNARDACDAVPPPEPGGHRVTVRTAEVHLDGAFARGHPGVRPGPFVALAVADTGCGMTPEVRARLFEPFFTTKDTSKGTGLGLSTVDGIVKSYGGAIEVETAPGRGATFTVFLPRAEEQPERHHTPAPAAPRPRRPATVLVVDDDDMVRRLIRMVLVWNGHTVLEACDGREALAVCENHLGAIDLLLTDVAMPQVNGPELAERLAGRKPGLKVLFISGYADEDTIPAGLLRDGRNYVQKPFTPDELVRKIDELLG